MNNSLRPQPLPSARERIEDLLWDVGKNCVTAFILYVAASLGGFIRPDAVLLVVGAQLLVGGIVTYVSIREDIPTGRAVLVAAVVAFGLTAFGWFLFLVFG